MAPELDVGMSVGMGIGMGMGMRGMRGMEAAASSFSTAYVCGLPTSDAMRIDDLLDFSNQDDFFDAAATNVSAAENHQHYFLPMQEPSATAGLNLDTSSSNSSTFSDHLYVPSEEAAELEWLSKFVDDSFSDVPFASSLGGFFDGGEAASAKYTAVRPDPSAVPARARSKRSRAPANVLHHALSTWPSPAPPNSPSLSTSSTSPSSSSSEFPPGSTSSSKPKATIGFGGRKEGGMESGVRRCTHCASEKTPQWRTGPLGPKTLCNACGVRYKSGRLVPEYRPAASPTFLLTQHSNSHRKVMELRRQKDLLLRHPGNAVGASSAEMPPDLLFGGYEAC